jgi:hypothetical protein
VKTNYVPPKQGWFGQVFDSVFILVLVFASLLAPLLLKSSAAQEAAAAATTPVTWESLHLSAIEQEQWIKLGVDANKAAAMINTRFDYSIDFLSLGITVLVIAGYFTFMLKVSEKEYREIIAEKFGENKINAQGD